MRRACSAAQPAHARATRRLYAVVARREAFLPGWPAKLPLLATELLPTIGDGVAMQAAIGDVDADHPGPEIVAASAAGPIYVLDADGRSVYGSTAVGRPAAALDRRARPRGRRPVRARTAPRTTSSPSIVGFGGPSASATLTGDGDADVHRANTPGSPA